MCVCVCVCVCLCVCMFERGSERAGKSRAKMNWRKVREYRERNGGERWRDERNEDGEGKFLAEREREREREIAKARAREE